MEETVKQRLIIFLKSKNLSQRKFEEMIGASNGYVNNISKSLGLEKIAAIKQNFPLLNVEWLLTGEGDMLNENTTTACSASPSERTDVDRFLSIIEADHQLIREMVAKKDEEIDRLLSIMEADRGITKKEKLA